MIMIKMMIPFDFLPMHLQSLCKDISQDMAARGEAGGEPQLAIHHSKGTDRYRKLESNLRYT